MKAHRFRAWEKNEKRFIYFELFQGANKHTPPIFKEAELEEWQQLTGFKDSDGSDLYEEDIVKWDDFYCPLILRWSTEYNWYEFVGENITCDTPHAGANGKFKGNVKLIGNTSENPELIPELSKDRIDG